MRRALHAFSVTALLAFAPACDSDDTTVGDDFREGLDVNIQLAQADQGGGSNDDGTIIWEIVKAEVYDGPAIDNQLLLYIEDNVIYNTTDESTCTVNSPYLNSNLREVIAANGTDVLFTVWNDYVFSGEVDVKIENFGQMKKLFGEQLLFQYKTNEIFLGEARDEYRLMTTNANLLEQSVGRQLLIAALITGECGSAGLPGFAL